MRPIAFFCIEVHENLRPEALFSHAKAGAKNEVQ